MKKYCQIVLVLMLILVLALTGCGGGSGGGGNPGGDTVINLAAIPGVVAPVRGEAPVTTPINTTQYTGSITWSPADDYFKPQTVYTANIVLTAKTGYNLNGVAENFFTVAGATTVTNAANSGVVTAVFPETGAADDVKVTFISAVETGGTSGTTDSTGLTLTFSADPTTLTADNITVTGATKGDLSGSGTTRTLAISNITVANGETVSVTITSPAGYSISGSPQTAVVYRAPNNVTFLSATQIGGASGTADSTGLTLTFSDDPTTLTADNITVTGATKGTLFGSGPTRTLAISNITVLNGETVSVTITSPAGYSISGSPQTAVVYRTLINVTFQSATQISGSSGTADSMGLELTFSAYPGWLTCDHISVDGAVTGNLVKRDEDVTGRKWIIWLNEINVANGETVSVTIIGSPPGYAITGPTRTAVVYRALRIGMEYLGGKIAYVLQSGDPGYDANEPHGLIAATADQSTGIGWGSNLAGTGTALGTGFTNTEKIIAQNGTNNAAGVARAYNGGGYSDWYLPSRDELNKLYDNRSLIGGFSVDYYWSSSEKTDSSTRWGQYFGPDSAPFDGFGANFQGRVRAVRSF